MVMRIQYSSDLHLEQFENAVFINKNPFSVVGDVLVLAGDTLPLREFKEYSKHTFFDWCAANYRETFLIPGNHEYYGDNIDKYPASWEMDLRHNVHMLENRCVRIDDVDIILSTLWTHIPMKDWFSIKQGMADFRVIRTDAGSFTAVDYNLLHERDLSFIKNAVADSDAEHKVVVTHHVPSQLCVAPEFKNSSLGAGFTVDLTDYIKKSGVDVWIYGHSHRNIDTVIGKTKVVTNQVGYVIYREFKEHFSGSKYISINTPNGNDTRI